MSICSLEVLSKWQFFCNLIELHHNLVFKSNNHKPDNTDLLLLLSSAEVMIHQELTMCVQDLIIVKYLLEQRNKRISKMLEVPWNSMKDIIGKGREQDVHQKFYERTRTKTERTR